MSARSAERLSGRAAQVVVSDEVESDDNLVRRWQDEFREARDKMIVYRSDHALARAFRADAKHTAALLEELPSKIATRRADITQELWAREDLAPFAEIPVLSRDKAFASVSKEDLEFLAPELTREIPKKSALWAEWSVWNFRRRRLKRAKALPAEAIERARGSLKHFERLEVWQAVGMADPWLVGVLRTPSGRNRFYLLYDWGLETTLDRALMR